MAQDYDPGNSAWRDQVRENAARHASAYKTYGTVGSGEVIFEEPVDFGLIFTEEPNVAYGFALDNDVVQELVEGDFPTSSGGVIAWDITERGLYIGATVFAVVGSSNPTAPVTDYSLIHHFTFSGIAVKDVGDSDFEEDD